LNLILFEAAELAADGLLRLVDARAAHIVKVLRVVEGDTVRIGLIDGPRGVATVRRASSSGPKSEFDVELDCVLEPMTPAPPRVDLLLAVPRPKVLRRLWAQFAALGVSRVILTNAERVERPYFDTHFLDERVYRPLLIEGLQQAKDTRVPRVSIHRRFKPLIEDELAGSSDAATRIVADPAGTRSVGTVVRERAACAANDRVLVAIGPEGGWNEFELDLLEAHGFQKAGMGVRTLRTDTACVAILALIHDALRSGD
jgi:16S rRNA (uracil1498-N3)-methyltransferase